MISEHEPRKGTETVEIAVKADWIADFRTRTPKGDGNMESTRPKAHSPRFQNTNPERGRKHPPMLVRRRSTDFRTRTPKGDGNKFSISSI